MKHPAELALHQYLDDATCGKSSMSPETIKQIGDDVMAAAQRQFGGGNKRGKFSLRMSNVGRPTCQLWYDKNKPEVAVPLPTTFVMNMMIGDIVEAVFKGILTEAGVLPATNIPRVELANPDPLSLSLVKSPKSIASPSDAVVK